MPIMVSFTVMPNLMKPIEFLVINECTKKTSICVLEYYLSLEENLSIGDTNERGHCYAK